MSFVARSFARVGAVSARAALRPATFAPALTRCRAFSTFLDKGEVTERVMTVVKDFEKVDAAKVTADSTFQKDLGLDSLDAVELVMAFEDEFTIEIPDTEADKILGCADAVTYISSHPSAK